MPDTHITIEGLIPFYPSRDLAAASDFYRRELGLVTSREQPGQVIFRVCEGAYLGFRLHDEPLPEHSGIILTFLTDEVDELYQRLRHHGIETEGRPKRDNQFGTYGFAARDPDGYRIEVRQFPEPLT